MCVFLGWDCLGVLGVLRRILELDLSSAEKRTDIYFCEKKGSGVSDTGIYRDRK